MVKQNGQKSDSIDEKRKIVYFQTCFSNAYKRSRPYAIYNMHYKCILLRTYYGSDPNPCIMRYMQYDLMHYEQVYCTVYFVSGMYYTLYAITLAGEPTPHILQ